MPKPIFQGNIVVIGNLCASEVGLPRINDLVGAFSCFHFNHSECFSLVQPFTNVGAIRRPMSR